MAIVAIAASVAVAVVVLIVVALISLHLTRRRHWNDKSQLELHADLKVEGNQINFPQS